ncbi:MAG: thioredoxin-disulfide reductase [Ruminococcaceae bacterium]|nr:thioredoxin-disulfide reductase [Oscillospiraceae bacterium]
MSMKQIYDMLIIGGGPGGYTAALYAARAGLNVILLEKLSAGGQMAQTNQVDNYPGFEDGIDGFLLAEKMQRQAERFGAKTELAEVYSLRLESEIKEVETSEGVFRARTVVIATGANPRELGVPGEKTFAGRGVHYCAACDGMFYRGKTVAVIGGGNSAAADALTLSRVAKKVIVIHRRDTLRATKIYHQPLLDAPNVEFFWNSGATALLGEGRLTGAVVKNLLSGEESHLELDGVFVSIGRAPASQLIQGQVVLDEAGYIVADESTKTSIPGVFAVGDVRTKALRQIVTAVSDGAMAVHAAEEYLAHLSARSLSS